MLPKSFRLSRPDILKLRAHGHRLQGPFFSFIYSPNFLSHLRLSVEISLRVDKRATRRNQLRRKIFASVQKSPVLAKSLDILVIVKPSIRSLATDSDKVIDSIQSTISRF